MLHLSGGVGGPKDVFRSKPAPHPGLPLTERRRNRVTESLSIRADPLAVLTAIPGLRDDQFAAIEGDGDAGGRWQLKPGRTGWLAIPDDLDVQVAVTAAYLDHVTGVRAPQRAD